VDGVMVTLGMRGGDGGEVAGTGLDRKGFTEVGSVEKRDF
jgi:hypothetical protein